MNPRDVFCGSHPHSHLGLVGGKPGLEGGKVVEGGLEARKEVAAGDILVSPSLWG